MSLVGTIIADILTPKPQSIDLSGLGSEQEPQEQDNTTLYLLIVVVVLVLVAGGIFLYKRKT